MITRNCRSIRICPKTFASKIMKKAIFTKICGRTWKPMGVGRERFGIAVSLAKFIPSC